MTDPKTTTGPSKDPPTDTEEIDTDTQRIGRGQVSYRKAGRSVLEASEDKRPADSDDG